jgi:hypothetical protein
VLGADNSWTFGRERGGYDGVFSSVTTVGYLSS